MKPAQEILVELRELLGRILDDDTIPRDIYVEVLDELVVDLHSRREAMLCEVEEADGIRS